MSKFKELKYVFVKKVNGQRRIYLNKEKIPTKIADDSATDCSSESAIDCNHNINNNYKNKYNNKFKKFKKEGNVPYWMEHPEVCKSTPANPEEIAVMKDMLKEFI